MSSWRLALGLATDLGQMLRESIFLILLRVLGPLLTLLSPSILYLRLFLLLL